MFSPHFDRTDVEIVLHSDNGFATVAYLRVKGATFEEKQGGGGDLVVPPLLEGDFARIQTLSRGPHPVDTSIHAFPGSTAGQFAGPSRSRRGGWVSVGNVCYPTNPTAPFEEEVTRCFRELQGSFMSAQEVPL